MIQVEHAAHAEVREPSTGWTGGQYSVWRAALAAYFLVLALRTAIETWPADFDADAVFRCRALFPERECMSGLSGLQLEAVHIGAVAASVLLFIGLVDRIAALALVAWLAWMTFTARESASWTILALCGALAAHASMPVAPFGSLSARGRIDPGGGWTLSVRRARVFWLVYTGVGAWFAVNSLRFAFDRELWGRIAEEGHIEGLAAPYTWFGSNAIAVVHAMVIVTGLAGLALFPLVVWRRAWFPCWCLLAASLVLRAVATGAAPAWSTLACALFLALLFDPAWIPARKSASVERVYYDGECGLCQRTVRFLLAEDREQRLRFAPLQGETFAREVPGELRANLPDSIVVQTADGRVLTRSSAVLHVLQGLGGLWRVLAFVSGLVPRAVRDALYDSIARVRKRLFTAPKTLCPLGPAHVTRRFDP